MAGEGSAAAAHARFLAAHAALRADPAIQFDLPADDPPRKPPAWLTAVEHAIGRGLDAIGHAIAWCFRWLPDAPYPRILLWTVIGAAGLLVVALVIIRVRSGAWRLPRRRRKAPEGDPVRGADDWAPQLAPARALLREADQLAAAGRFAEAVHLLLQRSIEDIARRRPHLLRPALTSRDIAAAPGFPERARETFVRIARVVEASLFGGAPVDAPAWERCRKAYADLALPKAWT